MTPSRNIPSSSSCSTWPPASACLTPELLRLVYFLKERTFCTYYEAVKAVIPYGAQYKPAVAADV